MSFSKRPVESVEVMVQRYIGGFRVRLCGGCKLLIRNGE
jgi:hypothetical protein